MKIIHTEASRELLICLGWLRLFRSIIEPLMPSSLLIELDSGERPAVLPCTDQGSGLSLERQKVAITGWQKHAWHQKIVQFGPLRRVEVNHKPAAKSAKSLKTKSGCTSAFGARPVTESRLGRLIRAV